MALRPECVDMTVYNNRKLSERLIGVLGKDPRTLASKELGEKAIELIVHGMIRKGRIFFRKVEKG